jgi:hypothetical protein
VANLPSDIDRADRRERSDPTKRFYVSCAWADESDRTREEKVDVLCEDAKNRGLEIIRDKTTLAPGDVISEFMEKIADGDRVFIFLSEKYLKSAFCMFELFAMWRSSAQKPNEFRRRVRFFTLDGVKIAEPEDWLESTGYWKTKRERLGLTIDNTGWRDAGVEVIKKYFMINEFAGSISNVLALFADTVQPRTFEDFVRYGFDDPPGSAGLAPRAITASNPEAPEPGRTEPISPTATRSSEREFTETPPPAPPISAEPIDRADLNKGRFGGSSEKNGLRFYGDYHDQGTNQWSFAHDLIIERIDGKPLIGPARILLHESFGNQQEWMAEPDSKGRLVLTEISAYGVYTAGAVVKAPDTDEWILLEYDVTNLPGLPERFKEL